MAETALGNGGVDTQEKRFRCRRSGEGDAVSIHQAPATQTRLIDGRTMPLEGGRRRSTRSAAGGDDSSAPCC
jgi:hypothetical protein